MKISPLGIDYATRELLFRPLEEETFAKAIIDGFGKDYQPMKGFTDASIFAIRKTKAFGGIPVPTIDLTNTRQAGWTFLINEKDLHRNDIIETIRPLAEHRGMKEPDSPLLFDGSATQYEWREWIRNNYDVLDYRVFGEHAPHYILIVGGPDQVPFHFQALLDIRASVGRLDFNSIDDLKSYVDKIIRIETSDSHLVAPEATFFATDYGIRDDEYDPTFYSHHHMARPLAERVRNKLGFEVHEIMEDRATKENLLNFLKSSKPALVYTASHGMGGGKDLAEQKRVTGAICCQDSMDRQDDTGLLMAEDIPADKPFLEGGVFFQFACFGYGTPQESDFKHWFLGQAGWKRQNKIAETDFVSELPKKMLANPRGPIAYIGHIDLALLAGFDEKENVDPKVQMNPRIHPFVASIETLLRPQPIGLAMNEMNMRYAIENTNLSDAFDILQRGKVLDMPYFYKQLANCFLSRTDAQNFMILGDPAVYLRINQIS